MNRLEDNQTPQQGGDIDSLLHAYFRSQMPNPWPPFRPSRQQRVQPFAESEPSRFLVSSKFALALSLGLLMLCGWLLSDSLLSSRKNGQTPELTGPGTATQGQNKPPMPAPSNNPSEKDRGEIDREQGDDLEGGFDRELFPNR